MVQPSTHCSIHRCIDIRIRAPGPKGSCFMRGTQRRPASPRSNRISAAVGAIGLLMGLLSALAASPAAAHVERPSYWPDPKPDTSVNPPAGGEVPEIRTLASALDASKPGETRVVCTP